MLQDAWREGLAGEKDIRSAWLYGSVARGDDAPRSDVDVALVVNEDSLDVKHRVRDAVQALGDRLTVHFSTVVLTPADAAALPPGDPWWSSILSEAKILNLLKPQLTA